MDERPARSADRIQDFVAGGSCVGLASGSYGVCKTFSMVAILLLMVSGLGRSMRPRMAPASSVAYLVGEGGLDQFKTRLRLAAKTLCPGVARPNFAPISGPIMIDTPAGLEDLDEKLQQISEQAGGLDMLVVDTFRANSTINDRADSEVSHFLRNCRVIANKYECAVLIIHHGTKSDSSQPAGGYALQGDSDFMIRITRPNPSRVVWESTKLRDGATGRKLEFDVQEKTIRQRHVPESSLVLVPIDSQSVSSSMPIEGDKDDPVSEMPFRDQVLNHLAKNDKGISATKLCDEMGCGKGRLLKVLRELSSSDLVTLDETGWHRVELV